MVGKADLRLYLVGFFHAVRNRCTRHIETDVFHRPLEFFAVFSHVDGFFPGTDHFHVEFFQHAFAVEIERAVQCRLATHGGQQGIGPFFSMMLATVCQVNGFDVGRIGHLGVGHDGGRIRVHQDHPVALFLQRTTSLRA